ncbi:MAG: alginate export family protein [Verrucomicrobia bacterium]|nr:alginate export family protein [Verrucomicrobiota bacterium]
MKTNRVFPENMLQIAALAAVTLCGVGGAWADDALKKVAPAAGDDFKTPIIANDLQPAEKGWRPGDPMRLDDGRLIFDAQERLRFESRENNFDFDCRGNALSITDDSYLLQRFRLGLRYQPDEWRNAYFQTQDSREIGSTRPDDPGFFGSEGDQNFALRQANLTVANFKECPFGVTAGRQELSYGDERLVGAFDWNNIGRVFDGFKFRFQQAHWNLEAFAVMPVSQYTKHFDVPDADDKFYGMYYQMDYLAPQVTEFYVLYRNKRDNDAGFPVGGYNLGTNKPGDQVGTQAGDYATLGARVKSVPGKLGPWDYGLEVAGQTGSVITDSVDTNLMNATTARKRLMAYAAHVMGGYTFQGKEKIRLGLEYDYASGDGNPGDGNSDSFQNLFPTNHKFYGYMDLFAWRNMQEGRFQFNITPVEKLVLQADYHAFWLADTSDAWFRANATTPVRGVGAGLTARDRAGNFAGQEIDFTATYPLAKWVKLHGGYSHFFAGQYLRNTGSAADADFFYLQTVFQF